MQNSHTQIGWQRSILFHLLALLAGILLVLAFAPYALFPLAIFAMTGLFLLTLHATAKQAFRLGWLFGLGLFGTGVHWIYISIHTIGDLPAFFAASITIGFIAILALFPACVLYIAHRYFPTLPTIRLLYVYPSVWIFSEWIRSWIFSGFPWFFLGYSQTNSFLKGYAPILGVYGLSLAVLLTSALCAYAILQFKQRVYLSVYKSIAVIGLIWIAGAMLNEIAWTKPQGQPLSLALVQGNVPQTLKWSPANLELSLTRYQELSAPLWGNHELIIWPESAIPLSLQDASTLIDYLNAKALSTHSHLIMGIPIQAENSDRYHNAIITLGRNNQVYLKRLLVPFGEFTPFSTYFARALNFMNVPMSDMIPGRAQQAPLMIGKIKLLPSICYEIAFPDLIRTRDQSIGALLTLTNDAWFGKSNAQAQHLQMAAMRALEFKRPLIFVSNDGITAIIGPDGRIQSHIPAHTAMVLTTQIQPRVGLTPWMQTGSDTILAIAIGLLITALFYKKRARTLTATSE